ncbi:MAG: IS30 family transposase [Candidatus Vogelbacteria bacterium]|nr:IS30 family transposase [Candidatus Vogelbacteria bacterium]
MAHQQLTIEEREEIQRGLWGKESLRSIAKRLGRSHTSISREIKKNLSPVRERYTPRLANERTLEKRTSRGRILRLKNKKIRAYVVSHLKGGWSPEQIAGTIHVIGESISHEAIYQYVYAQMHRKGYGYVKPGCEDLRPYLARRHKRRVKMGGRKGQRVLRPDGKSIEARPLVVTKRTRIGDWEGDSIESKNHAPGLNALVDRRSGLLLLSKLRDKTSAATRTVVAQRLKGLSAHTLTLDNGPENRMWSELEEATGASVYFAHPYCSGERGTNENTNGLVRRYFPKGTDFSLVTDEEIAAVEYALNTRPRKRHGYRTPLEVWSGALTD